MPYFGTFLQNAVATKSIKNYLWKCKRCSALAPKNVGEIVWKYYLSQFDQVNYWWLFTKNVQNIETIYNLIYIKTKTFTNTEIIKNAWVH